MRKICVLVAATVACTQPTPSIPSLRGFTPVAATDQLTPNVLDKVASWRACDPLCVDYGGMELTADVAPNPGNESILASYSTGLVVLDESGRLIARGQSFDAAGSADELLAVAVGDVMLDEPVIVISARVGGRRENEVRLELYRVETKGKLVRLFAAVVEEQDDQVSNVGTVTFIRGGLMYRRPGTIVPVLWVFDRRAGRYLERGPVTTYAREPARNHDSGVRAP
jgi:hypothetical protein